MVTLHRHSPGKMFHYTCLYGGYIHLLVWWVYTLACMVGIYTCLYGGYIHLPVWWVYTLACMVGILFW